MFGMDSSKLQEKRVHGPSDAPQDAIVSPDTRRAERLPPHQSRTLKWPVLDASGAPRIDLAKWRFSLAGLVEKPVSWSWEEFQLLPRVKVFADFHCVTRWSRLGNVWEGVSTRELVARAGGVQPAAQFVLVHAYDGGYDDGWTTNLPLSDFLSEDALVALTHDGEPITEEHGGPARLIVPRLYAWKSAKWVTSVEFLESDQAGFWERGGYHMRGDPWEEERFGD
jgi:DMSO/TMAO reductase YedYZ molybdopterin-dependent catalytic subunit